MSGLELFRLLAGLAALMLVAQLGGALFSRIRQPPVVGEILGGLLLGPTLLGVLWPAGQDWLFPTEGPASAGRAAVYQLGMLLLMFLAGTQMRSLADRGRIRTIATVSIIGMVVPFGLGIGFAAAVDTGPLLGPAADRTALMLIIAVAVAITSIPVISRIMLDLGLLGTRFAQVVLAIAVSEDIVLNVVLAIALGRVDAGKADAFGLAQLLGITSPEVSAGYHAVAPLLLLAACAVLARLWRRRRPAVADDAPRDEVAVVARSLLLVLGMAALCVFVGVVPIFGAFVAGLLARRSADGTENPSVTIIRRFSLAFPIPLYFAMIGLGLDLVNDLAIWSALGFIAFACVVKAGSVYAGARVSGSRPRGALDLAVALNARGGPGIVLAGVAHEAGIVSDQFFTTLVLTAVLTSMAAGTWLEAAVARGHLPTASSPENAEDAVSDDTTDPDRRVAAGTAGEPAEQQKDTSP